MGDAKHKVRVLDLEPYFQRKNLFNGVDDPMNGEWVCRLNLVRGPVKT